MSSINNISLYIPHVFSNISKEFIAETFEKLKIGKVNKIDFVYKIGRETTQYNTAYVHFEYWYDNTAAYNFQQRVLNPEKEALLIYDDPWHWIVLENKAKKHVTGDRKPRIVLDLPEEDVSAPNNEKQMTNQDFSKLMNVETKRITVEEALAMIPPSHRSEIETDSERMQEFLEEDCEHFITVDGRYVQELEEEVNFGRANVHYVCGLENENQALKNENQALNNENQGLNNEIAFLRATLAQMSQRY